VISLNPTTTTESSALNPQGGSSVGNSGLTLGNDIEMANQVPQAVEKWAAIAGQWAFSASNAHYNGPDATQSRVPLGLAKSSLRFRDGVIRTRIKLNRTERTAGGLFFGFQSMSSPYFMAQIGGFDRAYVIGEYRPTTGWFLLQSAGMLSNLSAESTYDVQASITGQSVRLTVDDVEVLNTVLTSPMEGTGFGLYAWDDAPVEFAATTVERRLPRIFVIMPFAEPFDTLYRDVIFPVARNLGFEVVRVDEIVGPGIIIEDIQRQVEGAHAVVAEISTHNPNVFYELGYAHALRKPAILLVRRQEGQTMPFDIRGYRAIFYDDNIGGKKTVERNLEQHLKAILGE
jgi:hypothetical protein